jgi:ABC-type antimicrobial peptide transport system permease subunit
MSDVRDVSLAPQRFLMALLLALAAATLLLAGIGIHGLIATSVTERTREIGIRIALGATVAHAMSSVALPGIVLAAIGIAAGLAASFVAVRALRSFVWGVSATDPLTFAAVGAILFAVAATASVLPTLRILRLDPATTLREE